MKYNILFILIFLCLGASFFYIWHQVELSDVATTQQKRRIVCTTMLLADLVKNLTPDDIFSIYTLMGPGIDPHTYKARPSDIKALLESDIVIYNGLHLEGKMGELLHELGQKKLVICATDALSKYQLISSGYENVYDPHVWHDIALWRIVALKMSEILCDYFPEYRQILKKLYVSYETILDETAKRIDLLVEKIPIERRILVTAHDAFRYFGIRYNFTVLGLQGLSTESDVGIRDVHNLADCIVTKGVKAVFPESCISPRNMIALQEAVVQKGGNVVVGDELFSDSLSAANGEGPTYVKMLLHNVEIIINALEER